MLVTFIQGGSNKWYTLVGVRLSKSSQITRFMILFRGRPSGADPDLHLIGGGGGGGRGLLKA